jgi:arginyl-tRNA synthetase
VQYAAVRARNILRKLAERGESLPDFQAALATEALARQLEAEDFWQLLLAASKSGAALEAALSAGEPSHVARYAFQLAQAFNSFYHDYPILAEQNPEKRNFLLWLAVYFQRQLEWTLERVLGIPVPQYM